MKFHITLGKVIFLLKETFKLTINPTNDQMLLKIHLFFNINAYQKHRVKAQTKLYTSERSC